MSIRGRISIPIWTTVLSLIVSTSPDRAIASPDPSSASMPVAPGSRVSSDPETALRNAISADVKQAWAAADFSTLDSTADTFLRTREKTLSGKWRLAVFWSALADQLSIDWPATRNLPEADPKCRCGVPDPTHYAEADRQWDAVRDKLDTWRLLAHSSPHAQLAVGQYLIDRAWFYRGIGLSGTVPQDAWPRFDMYISQARATLEQTRPTSSASPVWFDLMFSIAAAQSWPQHRVQELIRELYRSGQSYTPAYQAAAVRLLPKWGGSFEALEKFARESMSHVDKNEGASIYSRIYWQPDQFAALSFGETRADWVLIKQGFDDMLRLYPDPRNLNGKAMFACWAGDRGQLVETVSLLGPRVTPDTWIISFEHCKQRYALDAN